MDYIALLCANDTCSALTLHLILARLVHRTTVRVLTRIGHQSDPEFFSETTLSLKALKGH